MTAFEDFVSTYADDPVGFVTDVVGMEPQDWQAELLQAVADGQTRLSVASGHGVGKSTTCAWMMTWFLATRFPAKIVVTAPTSNQLYDALFSELKATIKKLPNAVGKLFEVKSDRVELISSKSEAFISARTSSKERPEAMAGVHSLNTLLIADEASGIPQEVFEAASGSMSTAGAITVLLGNPVRSTGFFYDTHHVLSNNWWTRKVSCLDSLLVTPEFVEDMKVRYGEESNPYRVRVLGEFPTADDDTLIPIHLIHAAIKRDIVKDEEAPVIWGLDVARFGADSTVLCTRRSAYVEELETWRGLDLMQTVGRVKNKYDLLRPIDQPVAINVDSIGIGSGVVDRLSELGLPAIGVNVSESPSMKEKYNKLRDELWFDTREWLDQKGCRLPNDQGLIQDLAAPTYSFTSSGKLKVEDKASMKKRIARSPDSADALCLTFAGAATIASGAKSIYSNWSKPLEYTHGYHL